MLNSPQFYSWQNFRCAYTVYNSNRCLIPGRNVLPYESTSELVSVVTDFLKGLKLT
ncbi:MAG: hypothetical protein QNJ41_05580 [Xenococcaceae cyanobacterium MO_188.B32]|nr:hypothetical protein [Xenococcaceae cyanobacterium MO_188.B32]